MTHYFRSLSFDKDFYEETDPSGQPTTNVPGEGGAGDFIPFSCVK